MNFHALVRGAIQIIHKDESCELIQALGQVNQKGIVKPRYNKPISIKAQIQPAGADTLKQLEMLNVNGESMEAFLYSSKDLPVASINRVPLKRGGDFIKRDDGTYWLITSVIEDWTEEGWANVTITRQTTPPDFSASDWSDTDGS